MPTPNYVCNYLMLWWNQSYCMAQMFGVALGTAKSTENFISKILSKDLSPFENLHLRCCKDSLRLPKSSSNMGCRAELGRFPLIKDVIMNILKFDMRLQSVNNHDILKLAHVSQQRLGKNSQNTFTYYQLTNLLAGQLHKVIHLPSLSIN